MPKLMDFTNHIEKRVAKYLTENNYQFSNNQEPIKTKEYIRRNCGDLMRPIKFRAIIEDSYSKNNGSWVYGSLIKYGSFYSICEDSLYIDDDGITEDLVYIDERTVGQFTGVCDKNGTEIYEGDIVRTLHPFKNRKHIGEVIFEEYEFNIKGFSFSHYDYPGEAFSEGTQYMEVIGNIHENSQLLEGDKGCE